MGVVLVAVVALAVLAALAAVHRYLWRRLVRDVSAPGGWWRRTGTVLAFVLPLTTVATFVAGRSGAPFAVEQVLAWPGYLWLALLLYLGLAVLAGDLLRLPLRRLAARRAAARTVPAGEPARTPVAAPVPAPAGAPAGPGTAGSGAAAPEAPGAGEADAEAPGAPTGAAEGTMTEVTGAGTPDAEASGAGAAAPERPANASRRVFLARTLAVGEMVRNTPKHHFGSNGVECMLRKFCTPK